MKLTAVAVAMLAAASASAASLRTVGGRRVLTEGTTAELVPVSIDYEPTDDNPHGSSKLILDIHIPGTNRYIEVRNGENLIDPSETEKGDIVKFHQEMILVDNELHIPREAKIEFFHTNKNKEGEVFETVPYKELSGEEGRGKVGTRKLADHVGTLTTLVFRVTDASGNAPSADAAQLSDDIFTDSFSLKTGYEQCSYGKLKIEPYKGDEGPMTQHNGIAELRLPKYTVWGGIGRTALQSAAMEAAVDAFPNIEKQFDLVLFCMPGGSGLWQAYSFIDDMFSFYNDGWCESSSALMHQVGHNLGLAHSGTPEKHDGSYGNEYDDKSDIMGYSYEGDDTRMCFNPAKSWRLTWYEDRTGKINPLEDLEKSGGIRRYVINGVVDYKNPPPPSSSGIDAVVILQLDQKTEDSDYFVGYNRASGINADVIESRDEIVIVQKLFNPMKIGQSLKVASLRPGDSYVIENFDDKQDRNVMIRFIGVSNQGERAGMDATIDVIDLSSYDTQTMDSDNEIDGVNCDMYEIEVKTDDWPHENRWTIAVEGGIGESVGRSMEFTEENTLYNEMICLDYDKCYIFSMYDEYGDGVCCDQGNGYYKVTRSSTGSEIFESDDSDFTKKENQICTNPSPFSQ